MANYCFWILENVYRFEISVLSSMTRFVWNQNSKLSGEPWEVKNIKFRWSWKLNFSKIHSRNFYFTALGTRSIIKHIMVIAKRNTTIVKRWFWLHRKFHWKRSHGEVLITYQHMVNQRSVTPFSLVLQKQILD